MYVYLSFLLRVYLGDIIIGYLSFLYLFFNLKSRMVKTLYSPTQVQEILQNPYVKSCYGKSITFTDKAKIQSIKLRDQGCTHIEVFEKLGFPQYVLESDVPMNSLCRW